MKINKSSWHYRFMSFMEGVPLDETTVCWYFLELFISLIVAALFILFLPITGPTILLAKYISKKDFNIECPFGNVEFTEDK